MERSGPEMTLWETTRTEYVLMAVKNRLAIQVRRSLEPVYTEV